MRTKVKVNRTYKASVFELLYRDKRKLLELYNGLNGTDYTDPDELEMYSLENAIYMGMKNDVSFILASEMNLYEHQSTWNPNMPLRDLFYIARQLERYVKDRTVYSSSLVSIPVPRFVVFYNGTEDQPEKQILKLSDAYEKIVDEPELELKVTMLNINLGQNRALMEKCKTLQEYMILVTLIRNYAKNMPIEEAVGTAVTECIRNDVLRDFLTAQRMEVIAVSIFEWDEEVEMEKIRKAEREAARAAAMKEAKEIIEKQFREEIKEQLRKETEIRLRKEIEEQVRRENEIQVRKEIEEQVRKETEKQIRKEIEEQVRREIEIQVRAEIEMQIRKEFEKQSEK